MFFTLIERLIKSVILVCWLNKHTVFTDDETDALSLMFPMGFICSMITFGFLQLLYAVSDSILDRFCKEIYLADAIAFTYLTLNIFWQSYYISPTLLPCGKCGESQSYKRLRTPHEHYGVEQFTLLRLKLPTHPNLFSLCLSLSEAHLAPSCSTRSSLASRTQWGNAMCLESDFVHKRADS